ncbi:MAG: hypothetical protein ACHQFW_09915 [Chitinophagales bacterium]
MNIPGDDLFLLIRSLTASEKRYFKLFAQRQGSEKSKTYIRIFDFIDAQTEMYDEESIKTKLNNKADVKMLPQLKIYLHDLIMKSMRLYRSDKNITSEMFDLIQDELFYTEKGLIEQRVKSIRRTKELAYKHDLMYLLIAVLQRERIYSLKYTGGDPMQKIEDIHAEEKFVIERLNNESELGRIVYKLWAQFIIDPLLTDEATLAEFKEYKNHKLLSDFPEMKTFVEKLSFLRAHSLICRFSNDFKGVFGFNKAIVDLFADYPQHHQNVDFNYVDALNNYLSASHKVGIYEEFEKIIDRMGSLSKEKVKDEVSISLSVIQNKILYIMNTGKFSKSDEVIAEFDSLYLKHHKLIPQAFYILANYNISLILFIRNEWGRALDHCRRILDLKSNARQELQHGTGMLQLILHFESDNKQLLESVCRNIIRNMQVENRYNEFEKLFCSGIRKLLKTPVREIKPVFEEIFNDCLALKRLNPEKVYVLMTETLAWCKSKIDNKPLSETIFYKFEDQTTQA